MAAEPVTITPHDPRRTAFRAIVAALQADATLSQYVAVWDVRDGSDLSAESLAVADNAVRLTPVFEREESVAAKGGVRTWQSPVEIRIEARVASANVDNAINLAGLIEDAALSIPRADLLAAGISWIELGSPAAQAGEYITHSGSVRLMVFVRR